MYAHIAIIVFYQYIAQPYDMVQSFAECKLNKLQVNEHEHFVNVFLAYLCFLAPGMKLSKVEKQQQRKEKTRAKGNSESGMDKDALCSKVEPSSCSAVQGDVSL